MVHELGLQSTFYDYMLNGTKKVEIRLYDDKRKLIKIGDIIRFKKEPDRIESFDTKVVGLLKYNNFEEMFNSLDISLLADKSMTKDELIKALEVFYTKEKQEKYGVLGIMIELL